MMASPAIEAAVVAASTASIKSAVVAAAGIVMVMAMVRMMRAAGIGAVQTSKYTGPKPVVRGAARRFAAMSL